MEWVSTGVVHQRQRQGQGQSALLAEDWDDSAVLSVFQRAVSSHRTKNKLANDSSHTNSERSTKGEAKVDSTDPTATGPNCGSSNSSSCFLGWRPQEAVTPLDSAKTISVDRANSAGSSASLDKNRKKRRVNFEGSSDSIRQKIEQASFLKAGDPHGGQSTASEQFSAAVARDEEQHGTAGQQESSDSYTGVMDDALQNMLMAWYHSGYATGRYQTLLQMQQYPHSLQPTAASTKNSESDYYYGQPPETTTSEQQEHN